MIYQTLKIGTEVEVHHSMKGVVVGIIIGQGIQYAVRIMTEDVPLEESIVDFFDYEITSTHTSGSIVKALME